MALERLFTNIIEQGKKISIPRGGNIHKIDTLKKKIYFYKDNPGKEYLKLGFWKTPSNAKKVDFEVKNIGIGNYIIIPRFYDINGNLLKIGNR